MTQQEVTGVLGEPELVSADQGGVVWNYNVAMMNEVFERVTPYYLIFKGDKLAAFGVDREAAQARAIQDAVRTQAAIQALQNVNRKTSTETSCTSRRTLPGQVRTECTTE